MTVISPFKVHAATSPSTLVQSAYDASVKLNTYSSGKNATGANDVTRYYNDASNKYKKAIKALSSSEKKKYQSKLTRTDTYIKRGDAYKKAVAGGKILAKKTLSLKNY